MSLKSIDFKIAKEFRESVFTDANLIGPDKWDSLSEHLGFYNNNQLIGILRLTSSTNNKLPFCDYVKPTNINEADIEMSRFVIKPKYRNSIHVIHFFHQVIEHQISSSKNMYIDAITEGGIRISRYQKLGFQETNLSYFDDRYNSESIILYRPSPK